MKDQPDIDHSPKHQTEYNKDVSGRTILVCFAGYLVPGLGHALLRKWDRAGVFFFTIAFMFAFGILLHGELFGLEFKTIFTILKFSADAGAGLMYWIFWIYGLGTGDPTAYAYDYANVFLYVAGLLNMLVVIDAFDIAMDRKK